MSKDFDKVFKSKLENHSSAFPADMWDNIDTAINPPKRNNRFLWFSFLMIGVLGFIGGYVFLNDKQDLETETQSNVLLDSGTNLISDNTLFKFSDSDSDSNTMNDANSTVSNELSAKSNLAENQDVEPENQNEPYVSAQSLNRNQKTANLKYGKAIQTKSNTLKQENQESYGSDLKVKANNKRKITFTEPLLSFNTKSSSTECADPSLYAKIGMASNKIQYTTEVNSIVNPWFDKDKLYKAKQIRFVDIASLPSLSDLKYNDTRPLLDLDVTVPPGLDCPSWVKEKLGLYLEAYYAPEYGLRSFTAKDRDSTIMAHQDARNDTEKALISYSLGARALFLTPSGISFKVGVNYSQINERFTWQDPESLREISIVDTDPITGDTISSYVTYEYGTDVEERINKYKSIDLALLVGYEKHFRKKLSFSVNGGIYLNLVAKQRGMFLDPDGNRSWFSSDDGTYDVYKRSVGVSFFASGGLMYHWVDGIDFFAEPSLRFYTKSITLNDYPLNQNYVVMGIHTGIRYKF